MLNVVDMGNVQSAKLNKGNCSVNVIIWDAAAISNAEKALNPQHCLAEETNKRLIAPEST